MPVPEAGTQDALDTYEAMAPVYDDFTAHFDTDGWLADLVKLLEAHGLKGNRLLDVACGTGESFLPMLKRGWTVSACDLSPSMLARAKAKAGDWANISIGDMRKLPCLGAFDLVWALDDALNYLLTVEELVRTLAGMRTNLAEDGLLLFDANELLVYRTFYAETSIIERGNRRFIWRGMGSCEAAPGVLSESCLEVLDRKEGVEMLRGTSKHRQRHFPEWEIREALAEAGLECLGVFGQGLDGVPRKPLDPLVHTKAIYLARRA